MALTLVIAPTPGLGDLIVRLHALRALCEARSAVHVLLSVPDSYDGLLRDLLPATNLFPHYASAHYRKSTHTGLRAHVDDLRTAHRLRSLRASEVFILTDDNSVAGSLKMAMLASAAAPTARRWAMRSGWLPIIGATNVFVDRTLQKRQKYLTFIQAAIGAAYPAKRPPRAKAWAGNAPIVVFPGSKRTNRRWPGFALLVERLSEQFPVRPLVIAGSADERALLEQVAGRRGTVLAGPPMTELANLVNTAALVVCNDSGAMHLGVELCTPVVAICRHDMMTSWCAYPEPFFAAVTGPPAGTGTSSDPDLQGIDGVTVDVVIGHVERMLAFSR